MVENAFLGIDVSKGYADFLLLDQQKQVLEEGFQLQDNGSGRKQLKAIIEQWLSKGVKALYCGLESTGGYENNWYSFIKGLCGDKPLYVARLNPKAVKSVSDAALKRSITDAVSAENIAIYMMCFPEKIDYGNKQEAEPVHFKEGRQHYTYVRMLIKQKVQLTNQLEKLLYQYFAETLIYCRHGIPGWLLQILSRYPSAAAMRKAGSAKLTAIKSITPDKAKALLEKVAPSTQQVADQIQHIISVTAKEILHKQDLIDVEKKYLREIYHEDAQVKLLTSITGIGLDSAVALMLEIEDINRFASAKKLAAYFGVHPTFKQSGDGTWGSHMSKKGRGELRAILYMAGLTGTRCSPSLKQLYAKHRAKGMKHYQAMGVLMHKLLRAIYGILKNKTKWDEAVDAKNIKRAAEKQTQKEQDIKKEKKQKAIKKNRFQSLTEEAPISRRQAQKRKKQIAS